MSSDSNNITKDDTPQNGVHDISTIKHPLENSWVLWYYDKTYSSNWMNNLREIRSFKTIEDFWSLYNNVKTPSSLKQGCDYSVFKRGIKPMWEDPANKNGGRWLISLDKRLRNSDLDMLWRDTMLCLIGEAFENPNEVCGATVNIRPRGDKIGLWTSNGNNKAAALEIGRTLKKVLELPSDVIIEYQLHIDLMNKKQTEAYIELNSFCPLRYAFIRHYVYGNGVLVKGWKNREENEVGASSSFMSYEDDVQMRAVFASSGGDTKKIEVGTSPL
ncbi:hypothetical protein FQA39_LY08548 [Lamprigera yunnana]|nr:hypothetical protein FQA39_LY08548 [Lamprigera yunnana]